MPRPGSHDAERLVPLNEGGGVPRDIGCGDVPRHSCDRLRSQLYESGGEAQKSESCECSASTHLLPKCRFSIEDVFFEEKPKSFAGDEWHPEDPQAKSEAAQKPNPQARLQRLVPALKTALFIP